MARSSIPRRRSAGRTATRLVAAVTVVTVATMGLAATAAAQDRYTDVTSTHHGAHKDHIETLEKLGVFDGTECGARKFCPNDPAKRWAIAVWIVRVIDGQDPQPVAKSRFADVGNREWWMPYVERLYDLGITTGCKRDPLRYCPHDTVSRAQMASFLVRAFRLQRAPSANFADTRGNIHEENIDALFAAGITVGCKQRPARFCPDGPTTRAHMATFLNRGLINASGTILRDGTGTGTGTGTGSGNIGGTTSGATFPGSITTSQPARSGDTQIVATRGRTCAIRADETVTCWGGDDGFREHLAAADLDDVVAISTSDHATDRLHSCMVEDRGDVYCWGSGSKGQLGQGTTSTHHLPVRVSGIRDAVAVAAGAGYTCALHNDGEVSCWGLNDEGQLGNGGTRSAFHDPRPVPRLDGVVAITAGERHSCAIHRNGELSCWGWWYGVTETAVATPDEVTSVSIGGIETCITVADGRVFCWNRGETTTTRMTQVANIRDGVKVSVGNGSKCVLHLDGGVSCWGNNNVGQVGDGTTTRRSAPVRLTGITDAVDISVSLGSNRVPTHVCALHEDRSVSCWGSNEIEQLNDGTTRDGLTPREVTLQERVRDGAAPATIGELLVEWVDEMVDYHAIERDFEWLLEAWYGPSSDGIRDQAEASETGDRGDITVTCTGGPTFGCEVSAMTITDMSPETVIRQLARVYDLHTGLADESRPWGAAQLYFASRYPNCSTRTDTPAGDLLGAEALADTLLHITLPHAPLHYSENRECRGLPTSPSRTAEEVVSQALEARNACDLPDWYLDRIDDADDLWAEWRGAQSLPALANLQTDFGGLDDTTWIAWPLVAGSIPAEDAHPFTNDARSTC